MSQGGSSSTRTAPRLGLCSTDLCGNRINVANHRQRRNALGDK
ncbi:MULTISPECIES: CGNR zinc finger domain-containing protein [unclassified Rhodococcus (in: high G+C Gram-positive bacteria)]